MKKDAVSDLVEMIFNDQKKPLSVPQLQVLLAEKDVTPNKTTLYRSLQKLLKNGTIEEILLNSKVTFYELAQHHHHHFTCNQCEAIECIDDAELESKIHQAETKLAEQGFKVEAHQFSFSGTCTNCT